MDNIKIPLKPCWQGINRMTDGGFRPGEQWIFCAMEHNWKTGFSMSIFHQLEAFQGLDPVWPYFPEQKVLQIEVSKEFQEQQGFHSSSASREALLTVLDHRFKLMSFNRRELGISHEELGVVLKALLAKDLDKAVYLLYGYGLKAQAYLLMPELERNVRRLFDTEEINPGFSVQTYGNRGMVIKQDWPYLPHILPPHSGKVVKMPYGYGYGLHNWIGTDQRLPIIPASGRKQEYIVPDNPHMDIRVLVPTGNRQQKRRQRKTSS